MSKTEQAAVEAVEAFLRERIPQVAFGELSITVILHSGEVKRIDYGETRKLQLEAAANTYGGQP